MQRQREELGTPAAELATRQQLAEQGTTSARPGADGQVTWPAAQIKPLSESLHQWRCAVVDKARSCRHRQLRGTYSFVDRWPGQPGQQQGQTLESAGRSSEKAPKRLQPSTSAPTTNHFERRSVIGLQKLPSSNHSPTNRQRGATAGAASQKCAFVRHD